MEARGCVKGGCIGCAALGAAAVLLPLLLVVAGRLSERPPEPRSQELSRELPPLPPSTGGGAPPAEAGPEAAGEPFRGVRLEAEGEELALPGAGDAEPVWIVLELSKGSFRVEPGPPGGELRVEADYDASRFELDEHYDPEGREYRLRFDARGGPLAFFRRQRSDDSRVRVIIPRGYPVRLRGEVTMGESHLELGGLWLADVDLDLRMGSHRVSFSEPLPVPAASLTLEGSMGEIELENLGNASPRLLTLDHGFGAAYVDLEGAWRNDAEVEIEYGFGECVVRLPETAAVALGEIGVRLGEERIRGLDRLREPRPGEPTLRLSARGRAGELRIE